MLGGCDTYAHAVCDEHVNTDTTCELMSDAHGCQSKTKERDGSHEENIHGEDNEAINQLNPSLLHQVNLCPQIYSMGQEGEGKTLIHSSCVGSCDKSRQYKLSFGHLCLWLGVSAALSGGEISPNPSLKKFLALRNK